MAQSLSFLAGSKGDVGELVGAGHQFQSTTPNPSKTATSGLN